MADKTFKREVAIVLMLAFSYVVYTDDIEMVKVLVWPVFTFAAAAFGLDSYAKQVKDRAGSHTTGGKPE